MEVTYADLDAAPAVLLAGFEPEEESPIVYLRLRKAARKNALQVMAIAPFATRGLTKMAGRLIACTPGAEAAALDGLAGDAQLTLPGALILVGERLASSPGAFSAASRLAAATGARLAWVPRRAGERGAVEAGALPGLLPGGRPLSDASAREQTAAGWNVDDLPTTDWPRHHRDSGRGPRRRTRGAARSAASSLPTCPTRTPPSPPSTRRRSSSAWSCGKAR